NCMSNTWKRSAGRVYSMARNFRELEAKMSPRALSRSDAKSAKLIREMALKELRRAMGITQEQLARALRINQAGVSKIESRSDIFVSTLRKAIETMSCFAGFVNVAAERAPQTA